MTDTPRLSDQAFLIAWNPARHRMTARTQHPLLVSAAVLAELWLAGLIRDERGKAVATSARTDRGPHDPIQAELLRRIRESKPRSWKRWAGRDTKTTYAAVRARLEHQSALTVRQRAVLGLRWQTVTVRDEAAAQRLVDRCRQVVINPVPGRPVAAPDAALVALVASAELNTVFSGRERRAHRTRIAELAAQLGPICPALHSVVQSSQASVAG